MRVEPGQAADVEMEAVGNQSLQPLLVRALQVVVSDIGRVGEYQVIGPVGSERREVAADDPQARSGPQVLSGGGEGRIDLDAASVGNRLRREHLAKGRVERAGADRGIEERRGGCPALP